MIALCVMACAATYQAFSEQFYGDAGFLFQQDLAAARSVKITAGLLTMSLLYLIGKPTCLIFHTEYSQEEH